MDIAPGRVRVYIFEHKLMAVAIRVDTEMTPKIAIESPFFDVVRVNV